MPSDSLSRLTLPDGTVYSNFAEWAGILMGAVNESLSDPEAWDEASQPYVAENLTELEYLLPLLATCAAALEILPLKMFLVRHKENQNASGGSTSADTYNKHSLNDEVYDPDSLVSLSSGDAVVEAGTWLFFAWVTCYRPNANHAALYDVSGSVRLATGMDGYNDAAVAVAGHPVVLHAMSITGTKTLRVEVWTQTAASGNGLGTPSNKAVETYAYLLGLQLVP